MRVAIVGAGLGGLAAATCLAKDGHTVVVFERKQALSTQGGIIALRPSALKVLYDRQLQEEVDELSRPLGESQFRMLANAAVVSTIDLHEHQAGAEGLTRVTTRPVLASILLKAAVDAGAAVHFGSEVEDLFEDSTTTTVKLRHGTLHVAEMLLVADGIRSHLRHKVLHNIDRAQQSPIITDATFYVFQVSMSELKEETRERMSQSNGPWMRMTAWLGQDAWTMSAYDTAANTVDDEDGDIEHVRQYFETRACSDINEVLLAAKSCDRCRLAYMPSLDRWTSIIPEASGGRMALLGDAAHAILPNGGAGISMTIEDIAALSYIISASSASEVGHQLQLWQNICKPRADKLREFGLFNMRRMQGDREALAETARIAQEDSVPGASKDPNMHSHLSSLSFSRYLSGYDPVATAKAYLQSHANQ